MSTKLQYSYKWGCTVVNNFVEKYARGTDYLCKLLYIPHTEIRHLLVLLLCSGNSVKWEAIKRLIIYNQGNDTAELDAYDEKTRKLLYKRLVQICTDDVLDDAWLLKGLDNSNFLQ